MAPFVWLFDTLVNIVILVIVIQAIMSWLFAFNVISNQNMVVYRIWDVMNRLSEPIYRPVRRFMPDLGGVDITPMVVIVGLLLLQQLIYAYLL